MHQPLGGFGPRPGAPFDETAVAIVGMSCRFAGLRGLDEFWALLRDGREAIRTLTDEELIAAGVEPTVFKQPGYVKRGAPLDDMECFDAALFGLSPRDAAIMDPQHRHFLECTWEALENAGHGARDFPGPVGVFCGSGHNAYMPYNLLTNPAMVRDVGLFLLRHTSNDKDFLSTRVSYLFDFKGPSLNVQTACSTSLVAMHLAAQSLISGECDVALAGGASIDLPHGRGYQYEEGEILSPDGRCRPFDAGSQGTVFGSGVAIVVLRRLTDALADGDHIYAVVRGSAINNDGAGKVGYLAPSVDGQATAIAEALAVAGVDARDVDHVEAHGTGTPVGDPIEVAALTEAFRQTTDAVGYCTIGSVKGNIGHTDTAAGLAGVIKVALAMDRGELPPTLHFEASNPDCAFAESPFRVQAERSTWGSRPDRTRRAGISSLGVGGTNAHVVLEEAPPRSASGPSRAWQLFLTSAVSATAADANAQVLADHFAGDADAPLADAAFTLSVGRQHLVHRRFAVAQSAAAAAESLRASPKRPSAALPCLPGREAAFLFCGAGPQHVNMARGLYDGDSGFRSAIDAALLTLDRIGGPPVRRWLFPEDADREQADVEMRKPSVALPALFIVQTALARFWMTLGIHPTAMIGHSSGEYAAAHLAGVLDLESGLRIVLGRGRLFEILAGGAMLSVPLPEAELLPMLPQGLSIAAINAPRLCIVSGPSAAIEEFHAALTAQEIEAQVVPIAVAAHSPMLDPILPEFRALLETVRFQPPSIPFISNRTGQWADAAEVTTPDYWVRHLRDTVRFTDGLRHLLTDAHRVLLEVGPGRSMASLARQHPDRAREQPVLSSLRHPDQPGDDVATVLETLGDLWASGVEVDWHTYWAREQRHRVPLPTYQFDRTRHWIEPGALIAGAADDGEPLLRRDLADWRYEPVWSRTNATGLTARTGAALVFEDDCGLAAAIGRELEGQATRVVRIKAGRRFVRHDCDGYTIEPGTTAHYARLFASLAEDQIQIGQVYHCWLINRPRRREGDALVRGFHSLAALAPELSRHCGGETIQMVLATDSVQRVSCESALVPEKAAAVGAARVITAEYPELLIRSVDLNAADPRDERVLNTLARALIAELAAEYEPRAIALRAGERWVLDHVPMTGERADAEVSLSALPPRGTYVITGGLGGLGLAVAERLAERGAANLILIARQPLPPRAEWAALVTSGRRDCAAQARVRKVLALEARGAAVEVIAVDVASARELGRALRRVTQKHGRITGVFHAAGVLDDGLLETKSRASMDAVLLPKIAGTRALDAALRASPPDFLVLFSSISAFAGLPGQIDYAAANAFLDCYAQSRKGDRCKVVSIGWSQWGEVGMAAALNSSSQGLDALPDELGEGEPVQHAFLERIHSLDVDEYVVAATLSPERHWLLDEHRIVGVGPVLPGTGYLELARAAFALVNPGPVELSDVLFLAPFVVPEGTARELRVHLKRRVGDDWRFVLLGRPLQFTSEGWIEHATGTIALPPDLRHDVLMTAVADRFDERHVFKADPHLQFGPRWKTVQTFHQAHNEALLELALDPAFHGETHELLLHPALLDLATAGAQTLIGGQEDAGEFYAPFSYRRIMQHAPLALEIISHIVHRPASGEGALTAVFDVVIADRDGRVLVEVSEFTMMRVAKSALLAPGAPAASPRLNKLPARADLREALAPIRPDEGLAALESALAKPTSPHVIISPYNLRALVNRLRTPPKANTVASSGGSVELPATPTEQVIADLWSNLLGVAPIGRNDDFFDLGGHSLLAVQFANRLKKLTGYVLPLSAMLEQPTVANLAALLDPEGSAAAGGGGSENRSDAEGPAGLVTIRSGGRDLPIFFVHDGLGETLLYRSLALRLDPGRPIYGIEPLRSAGGGFMHTAIAEMAGEYIDRIRLAQPSGPYLLAGLCAGGVIAFEIARQLEQAGETVAFVGVIDAADVAASKRSFHHTRARLNSAKARLAQHGLLRSIPQLGRRACNALFWECSSRWRRYQDGLTVSKLREANAPPASRESQADAPAIAFLKLYENAHRQHRPSGTVETGSVFLFKASDNTGDPDDLPYGMIYSDVALGWGRRVGDNLIVLSVPGGHSSTLQEPYVAQWADAFQGAVDSAVAHFDRHEGPEPGDADSPARVLAVA